MGVVKNLLVRVGADLSELQKEMAKAQKFMKNAGKQLTETGKSLTVGLTLPILGVAVAGIKTASDLQEVQNVVDTAFGKSAKAVDAWAKTTLNAYGLTELQAKQFSGSMRAMLDSMGLSSSKADKMSMSLVGLAGDMASFYNLGHDEAWEKIRSGIAGETEPLKALGINMSVANLEAYALSAGIKKSWKEMTAAEQATLRYNYLMEITKNVQGDFSKTSKSFANQLRVVKGMFTDIAGQLMSNFIPYLEKALGKAQEALNWFRGLSDEQKNLAIKIAFVTAAIGPLLLVLGTLVSTASSILLWSKGVAGAFSAVQAGTKGVGAIFTAVFGPGGIVLLVLAGIALVVGGLVYLWKTNEAFRNAIITAWNAIISFMTPILSYIKDIAVKCWNDINTLATPYIEQLKNFIITAWNFTKENIVPVLINIKDSIVNAFNYVWQTTQPIINSLKVFLSAAWDFILAAVKFFLETLKLVWKVAFGFFEPIVSFVFNKIKAFWNTWGSNIVSFFKITWDTVTGVFRGVVTVFTGIFNALTGALTGNWTKCWNGIKSIFIGVWDAMKSALRGGINYFINGINSMIRGVNRIKIPDFVPGIGGKGFNIPTIPALAQGALITKPTYALVGEGIEDEAVLPLSKLQSLLDFGKDSKENKLNKPGIDGPLFVIEKFYNNTDNDIEKIMYQADFYMQRLSSATGGD